MTQTRILVAEDNELLRSVLAAALQQHGYSVETAENGQVALDSYDATGADIVILDVIMPIKEGIETIMELRRRHRIPGIIVMSGGGRVSPAVYLKIAKAYRADQVLEKPFSFEELINAIGEVQHRAECREGVPPYSPRCSVPSRSCHQDFPDSEARRMGDI
jgi:DNA-binding response OmpR family regulator